MQLETAARTRRLAEAMLAATELEGELVVANAAGRLELATRRARRLLRGYACLSREYLVPAPVATWLRDHRTPTFTVERDGGLLELRRLPRHDGAALAVERQPSSDPSRLTSRELQVMALVEEGRSNSEVAALLWLSPGTVRKHLENVYSKLGVRNRTAAVARLRRLEGREPVS